MAQVHPDPATLDLRRLPPRRVADYGPPMHGGRIRLKLAAVRRCSGRLRRRLDARTPARGFKEERGPAPPVWNAPAWDKFIEHFP